MDFFKAIKKLVNDAISWVRSIPKRIISFFRGTGKNDNTINTNNESSSSNKINAESSSSNKMSATLKTPSSPNELKILGYNCVDHFSSPKTDGALRNETNGSYKLHNGSAMLIEIPKTGVFKYLMHNAPAGKSYDEDKTIDNILNSVINCFELIKAHNSPDKKIDAIYIPLIGGGVFVKEIIKNLQAKVLRMTIT